MKTKPRFFLWLSFQLELPAGLTHSVAARSSVQIGGCKPGPEGRCYCPPWQQPVFKLVQTGCEISSSVKNRSVKNVKQTPGSEDQASPAGRSGEGGVRRRPRPDVAEGERSCCWRSSGGATASVPALSERHGEENGNRRQRSAWPGGVRGVRSWLPWKAKGENFVRPCSAVTVMELLD